MSRTQKIVIQAILTLGFIGIGIFGFNQLNAGKKTLEKKKPDIPLPMVRVISVNTGSRQISITGQGTVIPVREIPLVSQVKGKIVEVAPSLVNGGFFKKGERLLSIESVDYEIAVTLAKARVKEAESLFQQAKEASAAAAEEWKQHNPNENPPPLVIKEPQLTAARAKLMAERANLRQARITLERTQLTAPFNCRVVSENVDIGQYISPGQSLAVLQSTDAAEIVIPLEDQDLYWFDIPGFTSDSTTGAPANVTAVIAGKKVHRQGRVVRSEGRINERTRMINVVVRVESPYATLPPLAAGQFADIQISGRTLADASLIPRSALHEGDIVWVVGPDKNRLYFRKVTVARSSREGVVVSGGLSDADKVVISPLKTVTDGMKVRFVESDGGVSS